jgi:hypothetical protein
MHAARLKRHVENQKKIENWKWCHDPLTGTRELNGLKVMMALINYWDLKDDNNALYGGKDASDQVYFAAQNVVPACRTVAGRRSQGDVNPVVPVWKR